MPVFNAERFVREAIDSILAQTLSDFELIIINDGSNDRTGEILQSISDPRIRYIDNDRNLGLVTSLNIALQAARCEIVARMDGDDVSMPNRLIEEYRYLENHPEVGVVGSAVRLIDERNHSIRIGRYPADPGFVRWILLFTNPVVHPSVMMRKSKVQAVGGYRNYRAEDIDLWERLVKVTQITNLSSILLHLRRHSRSITTSEKVSLIASAAEISARMIEHATGQKPPVDLVAKMYGKRIENPPDSLEIANLIEKLYRIYVSDPGILPITQQSIRMDAARRILRLATYRQVTLFQRKQLIWSACKIDHLVLARAFLSRTSVLASTKIIQ